MLNKFFVLVILIGLSSLTAQTFIPKINSSTDKNYFKPNNGNDVNILAVMVEFQPDNFELTYGDGTFGSIYSQDYGNNIIDPLPHDQSYFEDHLQFAVNYFNKVSGNKVKVSYTVLPDVITVSQAMREYSPVGDESFERLANFSKEVWELVDADNPNFDFSSFNTFLIFHAGAGKDISTSDLFGEARDLPSIYMSLKSFKNIYGENFDGFQLSDGSVVNNTMILPETESREEAGFGGVSLIELSINGLIVSSIASHLGLPDLFDSETGKSAIGRFGLMDGQSLFAFAGLFPPEPSAWEKVFLGWEVPKVVNTDASNVNVTVSEIANEFDDQIIKVPINATEYYLIENRTRDANKDGITVTYKVGEQIRTINFSEDLDKFNNAFVDTIKGVVLDVDEYDWAVPGNGILIWHIDEKIIETNYESNRINVGQNRGVDLEEADGIQDIGEEFQTIFGETVIAEGEEYDLWYLGNTSKLYRNIFGPNSKPNTKTNSGANSLITISNFSEVSNKMSFDISYSQNNIKLLFQKRIDGAHSSSKYVNFINNENDNYVFISNNADLLKIDSQGNLLRNFKSFSWAKPAVINFPDKGFVIGTIDYDALSSNLNIYDSSTDSVFSIKFNSKLTSIPVIREIDNNSFEVILGTSSGNNKNILTYRINKSDPETLTIIDSVEINDFGAIEQICVNEEKFIATSLLQYADDKGNIIEFGDLIYQSALTRDKENKLVSVILTNKNHFYIIQDGVIIKDFVVSELSDYIKTFSLADLFLDGENYILVNNYNGLEAYNLKGVIADNFPFTDPLEGSPFNGFNAPLTFDHNNDGNLDILTSTIDGKIFLIEGKSSKLHKGFPISVETRMSVTPIITKSEAGTGEIGASYLTVISDKNNLYQWEFSNTGELFWSGQFVNQQNSAFIKGASNTNYISTYFPKSKTYNWPNPVYENETFIRTYVSEDSQVEVKIFDLSGDLVDEFEFSANGGFETEYAWNVSEIQSGAYFAHIEVTSSSGKSESKIIKIAVVK